MEIIVSHVNADFDSFAAMVAAKKLYPNARIVFSGSLNPNVREFYAIYAEDLKELTPRDLKGERIERIIVVDTKIPERLGDVKDMITKNPEAEIFTFDHHPASEDDLISDQDFSTWEGAITTHLLRLIREKNIAISQFEATLFALGIHEDTGSLTYPNTTAADAEALSYLLRNGAKQGVINYFLNSPFTEEQSHLLSELMSNAKMEKVSGIDVLISTAVLPEFIDNLSVITHRIYEITKVKVIFTAVTMRDRVYVVGRSATEEVDVGEVLAGLGGGGHPTAASAVVKNSSVREVTTSILDSLKRKVKPPFKATDIMSRPVRSISSKTSIEEASARLLRYGHTGLPVVDRERLIGVISRKDIDKAIRHGLSHAPVKGFISQNVVTIGKDASLPEMQRLMVDNAIGRLPVMENSKLIGIVTRKDILRALHGKEYFLQNGPKPKIFKAREMAERMKRVFPQEVLDLLSQIKNIAAKEYKVYLVGGIVRDLILGFKNLDVDLVVEGEGIDFARKIAESLGGKIRAHKKFGTAVVILPGDFRIDVASARTEYYEYPAALPTVEFASIRQDLFRRDFTINSMAIAISVGHYGELLDFFGGQRDIAQKKINVLHNFSFIEDPTRIFRAIRFEQRFGFKLSGHTESLAKRAIELELVGELTNVRVRDELMACLEEKNAIKILQRLESLGALAALNPHFSVTPSVKEHLSRIVKAEDMLQGLMRGKRVRVWLPLLAELMKHLSVEEAYIWSEKMRFKKVEIQKLQQILVMQKPIIAQLQKQEDLLNSRLYLLLSSLSAEALVYLYAHSISKRAKDRVLFYLQNLQNVKLLVKGSDFIEIGFKPSPAFGYVMNEVKNAKLNGKVRTKKEELDLAAKLLKEITKGENKV